MFESIAQVDTELRQGIEQTSILPASIGITSTQLYWFWRIGVVATVGSNMDFAEFSIIIVEVALEI